MDAGEVSLSPDQPVVPTAEQIVELQHALSTLPQIEPITAHFLAGGLYARQVRQDQGVLVVGKVHRREHFFVLLDGAMTIVTDKVRQNISAPYMLVSPVGTKRVLFANTDSIYMTVHRTDLTDLAQIEAELTEDDPSSNYGVGNTLLAKALESK